MVPDQLHFEGRLGVPVGVDVQTAARAELQASSTRPSTTACRAAS